MIFLIFKEKSIGVNELESFESDCDKSEPRTVGYKWEQTNIFHIKMHFYSLERGSSLRPSSLIHFGWKKNKNFGGNSKKMVELKFSLCGGRNFSYLMFLDNSW